MASVTKAQGEHCSIVTMYWVISEGSSVGSDPSIGTVGATRSLPGKWASWMTKQSPAYLGRDLTRSVSGILGSGIWNSSPDWVNTWVNQAIVIAEYIGYNYNTKPGGVNIVGDPGWLYGWWDAKGIFKGIPAQRQTDCLQCIWKEFQSIPKIKKVLGQKDSWNPTDTYMVQKKTADEMHGYCSNLIKQFQAGIVAAEAFVGSVDVYLSKLVKEKTLLPISLKKMTTGVSMSIKVNNVEDIPNGEIDIVSGHLTQNPYSYFELSDRSGKLDFRGNSLVYKSEFTAMAYRHQYQIEQRMQGATGNKQEVKDIVRTDAGGYKAAGAQAGNVPVDTFKKYIKEWAGVSNYDYKVGSIKNAIGNDSQYWADLYDEIKRYNSSHWKSVDLGTTSILGNKFTTREYFDLLGQIEQQKNDTALDNFLSSKFVDYARSNKKLRGMDKLPGKVRNKLYNLRFLQALMNADKQGDLCMLITSIYYSAAKMMIKKTDLIAPFLKLS